MREIKRLDNLDILKAIGIIFMIMGHIGYGKTFDFWIHSFHMPMFYIISGILYKDSQLSFKLYLSKKVKTLIIPYFVFAFFHLLIYFFLQGFDFKHILAILWENTNNMPICGALWFLTSLFFVDIMNFFLVKFELRIQVIISILSACFGSVISFYIRLPWALDTSFIGLTLFGIGRLIKLNEEKIYTVRFLGIISFIIGTSLCFMNNYINMREVRYGNIILFFLSAILSTIALYIFSTRLIKYNNFIVEQLKFVGRNSLVYVVLNQIVILFYNILYIKVFNFELSNNISYLLYKLCMLLIVMSTLKVLVYIFSNKYLKWCIGGKQ